MFEVKIKDMWGKGEQIFATTFESGWTAIKYNQNPKPELVPSSSYSSSSSPPPTLPSSITFFTSTSNINNSVIY